jgi:hypothetical protein
VRENLLHNWNLLKDADFETMTELLMVMIDEFEAECDRRGAEKLFRIHWDGDFFNKTYAYAWRQVIDSHPDIQFWVYTRSDFVIHILNKVDNLALYFSTDSANKELGFKLQKQYGVKLAYLAQTFALGKADMLEAVGKSAIPCPENNKKIPMISEKGSACVTCGQCVFARNDILFSATKK